MGSLQRPVTWAGFLLLPLLVGCHHLAQFCPFRAPLVVEDGPVCKVVATWNNQVVFTPDPASGGRPTPGLAGRIYLFDQTMGFPLVGDGALTVDLYEAQDGRPTELERWHLDAATLVRLVRKDTIGQGYTIFLPWGTYRPEIPRVMLKVCYQPEKGTPIYADSVTITFPVERQGRGPLTAASPMIESKEMSAAPAAAAGSR